MATTELRRVVENAVNDIHSISPESIRRLHAFFDRDLILGALDVIDRENVIRCITAWNTTYFEVIGLSGLKTVFLELQPSPLSSYCSCPAFAQAVLLSETHIMCKHILAVRLALNLGRCNDRQVDQAQLALLCVEQYT